MQCKTMLQRRPHLHFCFAPLASAPRIMDKAWTVACERGSASPMVIQLLGARGVRHNKTRHSSCFCAFVIKRDLIDLLELALGRRRGAAAHKGRPEGRCEEEAQVVARVDGHGQQLPEKLQLLQ